MSPILPTQNLSCDVVVLGSGGGAMAAAVTASALGLSVIVLERANVLGGTSAISGGALWIPGTRQAVAGGFADSADNVRLYLKNVMGNQYKADLIEAFLKRGPEALAFLEDHTEIKYSVRALSPDYYPELPGSTDNGRVLEMAEYDGRKLGPWFNTLRSPMPGMMLFGGLMLNREGIYHFLNMKHSLKSLWYCTKLVLRFLKDRLSYPRGTRLVIGNAMIAALLRAALDKGVRFELDAETQSFTTDDTGGVTGVIARLGNGELVNIRAKRGVVMGTGGLSRNPKVLEDRPDTRADHLSMASPNATGAIIFLAEKQLGAKLGGGLVGNFYWAPMSQAKYADGRVETFPHIVTDRAKPGIIAVTDKGVRFTNEADSYHRFVKAMMEQQREGIRRFYLLADHKALRAYGLGLARPSPGINTALEENGYLIKAPTIAALAEKIEIDPAMLQATIAEHNRDAAKGMDPKFHKGDNSYNKAQGDSAASNPCLAPLENAPFYAVRIYTGDLGSAKGLATDGEARVLREDGSVIPGLYAVGADMNSIVAGTYPGPGITLGPGLTFGYVAARSIADHA